MKLTLLSFVLCLIIAGLSNCALVATGLYQEVNIVSSEPESEVYLNDEFADSTPCIVKIRRTYNQTPQLEVRKRGYFTEHIELNRKLNHHIWLNLFDIPGWVIDFATGASVKYVQPDTVVLKPKRKG